MIPKLRLKRALVGTSTDPRHQHFARPPDSLEEHNNWVREHTPPDKFHEIELKDGWAPLCRILDKPVPAEPFPRANDAEAVAKLSKEIMGKALMAWVGILTGTAALGYVGWWVWKMKMGN